MLLCGRLESTSLLEQVLHSCRLTIQVGILQQALKVVVLVCPKEVEDVHVAPRGSLVNVVVIDGPAVCKEVLESVQVSSETSIVHKVKMCSHVVKRHELFKLST